MKIYTATLYRNNYGSALQAVALQQKIKELGGDAVIIGIRAKQERLGLKDKLVLFFRPEKHYGIIRKIRRGVQRKIYSEKARKINEFVFQNATVKKFEDCAAEIEANGGVLLAGSDQVWSTLNHPINGFYLFDYIGNPNIKRVSYAASIGTSEIDVDHIEYYKKVLKPFDVVSLREKAAYEILSKHLENRIVRQDVDPTLLFNGEHWESFARDRLYDKPYVFIYMLRPSSEVIQIARELARQKQLDIIYMGLYVNHYHGIKTIDDAGVEEFLSYIKHADIVVTNSFHGTVFSLLFEKKFVSVKIESTSSRVESLLNLTDMQDHLISGVKECGVAFQEYDTNAVGFKLEALRMRSIDYLNSIIKRSLEAEE